IAHADSASTTVAITGDATVRANFVPNKYSVTVSAAGSGSVTRNPDLALYDYGSSVVLSPKAGTGFHFTGWSGDASGSANPLTVTVSGNLKITANFSPDQFSLTLSGAHGKIT